MTSSFFLSKLRPWAKVILAVLAGILFIALLLGINEPHFTPFSTSLSLNKIDSCSNFSNGCVLIDSDLHRVIFTDKNGNVVRTVSASQTGSPTDKFFIGHIMNNRAYIIGCREVNGGIYTSSESVLEYDLNGNYLGEVFRIDYGEDERRSFPQYRDLEESDGLLYLVGIDGRDARVVMIDPSKKDESRNNTSRTFSEPLARISFFPEAYSVAARSITGNVYTWRINDNEIQLPSPEDIRSFYDKYLGIDVYKTFKLPEKADLLTEVTIFADQPKQIVCVNASNNTILVYDTDSKTLTDIKELPLHPWLYLKNLFFWIAVAVFSALALFGLFVLLRKVWSHRVRNLLLIAFVMLLVIGTLSWQQDQEIILQQQDHVLSISNMVALHLSKHHPEELVRIGDKMSSHTALSKEDSDLIESLFDELIDIANSHKKENSFYAKIYLVCPDGIIRSLTDTQRLYPAGEEFSNFSEIENELLNSNGMVRNDTDNFNKVYRTFHPVFDNTGKCIAIIEVGNYEGNLSSLLFQSTMTRMIALLAILVTVFITHTTVKTFRVDVQRYHEQKNAHIPTAGINLNGIYSFIYALSTRMDYIILPILSLKMCQSTQMDAATTAFMAALPLTANGIGLWIGNILVVPLSRRLGEKGCAVLSQSLTVLFCLLEAMFAFMSNIYLFTAAKLFFGIFSSGIMYNFRRTIPLGAPDLESRHRAMASDNQSVISATVLSTLIGGFITQYISDYLVYLLAAAMSVPLLFVCFYVFNGKKEEALTGAKTDTAGVRVRTKNQWGIVTKPAMISLLCLIWLAKEFEFGYPTYLFPLYTDSAGLTTIMITCLSVLAMTASSIVNRAAENYLKYKDRTKTMLVILLATAICMICFIFSPNLWWAIVTMFVVEIVDRITNVDVNIAFANVIIRYGYEPKTARAHVKVFEDGLQTLSKPILSMFVPLGHNFACAAVGAVCAVMVGVHAWLDRRFFHPKRSETESPQ